MLILWIDLRRVDEVKFFFQKVFTLGQESLLAVPPLSIGWGFLCLHGKKKDRMLTQTQQNVTLLFLRWTRLLFKVVQKTIEEELESKLRLSYKYKSVVDIICPWCEDILMSTK